jgi:hypothetical protein
MAKQESIDNGTESIESIGKESIDMDSLVSLKDYLTTGMANGSDPIQLIADYKLLESAYNERNKAVIEQLRIDKRNTLINDIKGLINVSLFDDNTLISFKIIGGIVYDSITTKRKCNSKADVPDGKDVIELTADRIKSINGKAYASIAGHNGDSGIVAKCITLKVNPLDVDIELTDGRIVKVVNVRVGQTRKFTAYVK